MSETSVSFRGIKEQEYEHYWATDEPRDKAGAYAIQGSGAVFVKHIAGNYSGIVGLPLTQAHELLEIFDTAYWKAL